MGSGCEGVFCAPAGFCVRGDTGACCWPFNSSALISALTSLIMSSNRWSLSFSCCISCVWLSWDWARAD